MKRNVSKKASNYREEVIKRAYLDDDMAMSYQYQKKYKKALDLYLNAYKIYTEEKSNDYAARCKERMRDTYEYTNLVHTRSFDDWLAAQLAKN